MSISAIYESLRQIAEDEFGDILVHTKIEALPTGDPRKLRLHVSEQNVVASHLSDDPSAALREFCTFVRRILRE